MMKKAGLVLAAFAAVAMIGAGNYAVACEGSSGSSKCDKEASTTSTTSAVKAANETGKTVSTNKSATTLTASGSGVKKAAMVSPGATCSPAEKAACEASGYKCSTKGASKASFTSNDAAAASVASSHATCSSKGASSKNSWAANVYKVENGTMYAVADGKRFVVTDKTPYKEVGDARYYFADENSSVKCNEKMSQMTSKYNHETAALASNEANVTVVDGNKTASCCGKEFAVVDDTPALVIDGQKVYFCSEKCMDARMNSTF